MPRQLIALFRARNRDGWRVSLTFLTALANFLLVLPEEESYLVLFHDARRVAAECEGQAPRRERAALASRFVFPPLSAGCGIGRPYAIVRRPSARCSRSLRAGPRRPNALYRAAVERWPGATITLRQGVRFIEDSASNAICLVGRKGRHGGR
jgi:hypothetical protein